MNNKHLIIFIFLVAIPHLLYCQDLSGVKFSPPKIELIDNDSIVMREIQENNKINTKDSGIAIIDDTELFINFPGGIKALAKYLKENLHYPDSAIKSKIEGKVYAGFIVDEKGKFSEIKIVKGLCLEIDKEVIRVVSEMPNWEWDKGEAPDRKTQIKITLPISFKL